MVVFFIELNHTLAVTHRKALDFGIVVVHIPTHSVIWRSLVVPWFILGLSLVFNTEYIYKVHGERILTNSTFVGLHNFNPLNSGFYIEYQRNKEQYKREDIAS